jgi:hypothetical protein
LLIISDSRAHQAQKMHSALTRANALLAYTMSVLASLTFLCFLSTFFNEYQVYLEVSLVAQNFDGWTNS